MLVELSNTPRPYEWGDSHSLSTWQGRPPASGPEAELWLGTHPGSEAQVVSSRAGETSEPLSSWLAHQGLGSELPFLTKLLAAGKPLSIQVHPTKAQATAGFAREEAAGVARDAPERNYRDGSDKPEVLIAWSNHFDALVGFQTPDDAPHTLEAITTLVGNTDSVTSAREALMGGIEGLVGWLFSGDKAVKSLAGAITEAFRAQGTAGASSDLDHTWNAVIPVFPGDPGIVAASFMNFVRLLKGEALFVPAGIVHAYLAGFGLEVMAPSDNVLRGGLTPKHIDLAELAAVVEPITYTGAQLMAEPTGNAGQEFAAPGAPFSILHVMRASEQPLSSHGPSIVVGHTGTSTLTEGTAAYDITEGHAYVWVPESPVATLSGNGSVYVVSGNKG